MCQNVCEIFHSEAMFVYPLPSPVLLSLTCFVIQRRTVERQIIVSPKNTSLWWRFSVQNLSCRKPSLHLAILLSFNTSTWFSMPVRIPAVEARGGTLEREPRALSPPPGRAGRARESPPPPAFSPESSALQQTLSLSCLLLQQVNCSNPCFNSLLNFPGVAGKGKAVAYYDYEPWLIDGQFVWL